MSAPSTDQPASGASRRLAIGGTAGVLVLALGAVASVASARTTAAMPELAPVSITNAASAQVAAAEAQLLAEQAAEQARRQQQIDAVVDLATAQRGDRYVYGASGPNAFDCSGFTMWVYGQALGVSLPHHTRAQWNAVDSWSVGEKEPQPGDLVFFFDGADHVGLYIGDGMMIHAANPRAGVTVDPVHSGYWAGHLSGFGRVVG
jgi:cell wall-associated NlpC family hydrolase